MSRQTMRMPFSRNTMTMGPGPAGKAKKAKFPVEFDTPVNRSKVNLEVIKPWIATRVTELLGGLEDEVLIGMIISFLEDTAMNPKDMQMQLTSFLEKNTTLFMKELWTMLISAQEAEDGVPLQLIRQKEQEVAKRKEEISRIQEDLRKKTETIASRAQGGFSDALPPPPAIPQVLPPPPPIPQTQAVAPQAEANKAEPTRERDSDRCVNANRRRRSPSPSQRRRHHRSRSPAKRSRSPRRRDRSRTPERRDRREGRDRENSDREGRREKDRDRERGSRDARNGHVERSRQDCSRSREQPDRHREGEIGEAGSEESAALKVISATEKKVDALEQEVLGRFAEGKAGQMEVEAVLEFLTQALEAMDGVETKGSEKVRGLRKKTVTRINKIMDRVDEMKEKALADKKKGTIKKHTSPSGSPASGHKSSSGSDSE